MFVRYYVLYRLPNLKFLDSRPVKSKEKEEGQRVGAYMKIVAPSSEEMVSEDLQWSIAFVEQFQYTRLTSYCTNQLANVMLPQIKTIYKGPDFCRFIAGICHGWPVKIGLGSVKSHGMFFVLMSGKRGISTHSKAKTTLYGIINSTAETGKCCSLHSIATGTQGFHPLYMKC